MKKINKSVQSISAVYKMGVLANFIHSFFTLNFKTFTSFVAFLLLKIHKIIYVSTILRLPSKNFKVITTNAFCFMLSYS